MSTYRVEWDCCGSVTETEAWAPESCPFCPDPSKTLMGFVAAQREKLAHWMCSMGYATGHGDTIEDLLDHLGTQIAEGLAAEVLMEREACAKECDATNLFDMPITVEVAAIRKCAAAIRARSKT